MRFGESGGMRSSAAVMQQGVRICGGYAAGRAGQWWRPCGGGFRRSLRGGGLAMIQRFRAGSMWG